MGTLNFDATQVAPSQSFDPLPPGWYAMRITECEMVESPTADAMVKLKFEIDETEHPEFHNRCVFQNLCINHPESQKAREIANRSLSAICHAVGKLQVADTDDLLGLSLRVKLKVRPASTSEKDGKTYDAGNDVTGYKPLDEKVETPAPTAAARPAAPTAGAAPAAPAPAKPSWKK